MPGPPGRCSSQRSGQSGIAFAPPSSVLAPAALRPAERAYGWHTPWPSSILTNRLSIESFSLPTEISTLASRPTSVLFPIANDVKIQVEFNPRLVAEYRLIGYDTHLLQREDFGNDAVDAGDMGAGHEVTAFYEIATLDSAGRLIDPSRYGEPRSGLPTPRTADARDDEMAFVRVRCKLPGATESRLLGTPNSERGRCQRRDSGSRRNAIRGCGRALWTAPSRRSVCARRQLRDRAVACSGS